MFVSSFSFYVLLMFNPSSGANMPLMNTLPSVVSRMMSGNLIGDNKAPAAGRATSPSPRRKARAQNDDPELKGEASRTTNPRSTRPASPPGRAGGGEAVTGKVARPAFTQMAGLCGNCLQSFSEGGLQPLQLSFSFLNHRIRRRSSRRDAHGVGRHETILRANRRPFEHDGLAGKIVNRF